ncbi:cysteine protease ATG4A-like [Sinocyclocheilus rhinocerous]|uniref:cysteine protease ATG4A-like n=1 Tax=Sinocyclocheilus rhinocerous TaxID=307959 RepID=UPI0007B89F39|nr:PREDICTED: cysteine protease ATG4A-like [Sinocyclocheilus rhinocerous]
MRMEAVLAKYENQINVFSEFLEDLPDVDEPVWILGACYDLKTKKSELLSDVRSRLWFTYRKKFSPIGGTGPSSDAGWGCMLRCGQMILAQALVSRHLGRDWRWDAEKRQPKEYHRILHCFLDKKDSCYSIHQMAQMGVGEGKSVGEWYGPNTVAQVLKKLALFDDWNTLAVYVSMDNTVVIEDIKKQCKQPGRESRSRAGPCGRGEVPASGQSCSEVQGKTLNLQSQRPLDWRPLLLVIPLRMGINSINPVYIQAFKGFFCKSEEDFDSWCDLVQQELLKKRNLRMFELVEKHPSHWPPFVPPTKPEVQTTGAEFIESPDKLFESEEEFEILNV